MSAAGDVEAWLDSHSIHTVRTLGVSHDGIAVGKHLARRKFGKAIETGAAMSDFVYGFDLGGTPMVGWWADWRTSHLGDMLQMPDPSTLMPTPWQPGVALCLADHTDVSGRPLPVCTRSIVRRLTEHLAGLGFEARMSIEVEAMIFTEPMDVARARGFRGLSPLGGPRPALFYSAIRGHEYDTFMSELRRRLDAMEIPWEATNAEAALGQVEINVEASDPVTTADRTVVVRQMFREVALDLGHTVTFMAKPVAETFGGGAHIHHSLWTDGAPAFYDASHPDGRSEVWRHWLGGLMATLPGSVSLLAPFVTSFRRFVDFIASPTTATWCEDNKSTAVRTITARGPALARIEHRVAASDANPYLTVATVLAGGIAGLEEQLEPPPEFRYIAWGVPDHVPRLPTTILSAADALAGDERLTRLLGPEFVEHWVRSRKWEWLMFHTTGGDPAASDVTDWELIRYFEQV